MLPVGVKLLRVFLVHQHNVERNVRLFSLRLFTRSGVIKSFTKKTLNNRISQDCKYYTSTHSLGRECSNQESSKKEGDNTVDVKHDDKTKKELTTSVVKVIPESNDSHTSKVVSSPISVSKTKKYELKTSDAVISITTTIEDSKINDVVFQKQQKKSTDTPTTASEEKPANEIKANGVTERIKAKLNQKHAILAAATLDHVQNINKTKVPIKPPSKRERSKVDLNSASLERNFITPLRAMNDFLLKPSDLETLIKIKRRSPYEQEPPITVYWRRDVEAMAIKVWGSRENLLKERLKREIERKQHQQNLFTVKRRLRDYRREIGSRAFVYDEETGLKGKSGKVVLIAIGINAINCIFKAVCWVFTGSHSMFAETVHSLADTMNQCILAYGIHKSTQTADSLHPYGYTNMRYVSSLISGVGIFCVGSGLSYYHGIMGLINGGPPEDFFWAFFVLGGSLVSEGATLLVAINQIRQAAKDENISFKEYVLSGKDPCVNVVLMEDAAAVGSVTLAAGCMGLTSLTQSSVFDAVGSLLVGSILGCVASFIIYTNVQALVGKSIPEEKLDRINSELESDVMIRAIYDVKGIDMGNSLVRYKAEMDFDGRELTRSYLDKQDLNELLTVIKSISTVEELEEFLLNHGENIVDLMGGEIDRIEMKLRKKFPELRHCDLEIL